MELGRSNTSLLPSKKSTAITSLKVDDEKELGYNLLHFNSRHILSKIGKFVCLIILENCFLRIICQNVYVHFDRDIRTISICMNM